MSDAPIIPGPASGIRARWWSGTMDSQADIVNWARGQIAGYFGDLTNGGVGYYLLLPDGSQVRPGDGVYGHPDGTFTIAPQSAGPYAGRDLVDHAKESPPPSAPEGAAPMVLPPGAVVASPEDP